MPKLWDALKAVLREKFIVINTYIKKKKSQINSLNLYLEELKRTVSRRKKVKIRVEINEIETRKRIEEINKNKRYIK